MAITKFEDIEGWQLARELAKAVYELTSQPEFARDFGLKDQIQRAAGSVMHNIAEGFDSGSNAEFVRFLRYSQRSCTEVQSQLYIASDQNYITETQFNHMYELARQTRAKIGGFIKYLSNYASTKNQEPRTKCPFHQRLSPPFEYLIADPNASMPY